MDILTLGLGLGLGRVLGLELGHQDVPGLKNTGVNFLASGWSCRDVADPSPTLLHHSTGSRSSPDISLAPASLAPHCEWRTLPGLGSDHLPIEIVLPFLQFVTPTLVPSNSTTKRPVGMLTNHVLLSISPLDVDAVNIHHAARSFSLFLVKAAKASIPFGHLGRSPKAWWSQEAESAVRERQRAYSEAHRSESHRPRYIDASHRASSVISRAKSTIWQATCSNLSPLLILVLSSGSSMPSRAKRTPPKTLLFPVAVPLLTLPITMPLIFAHIYLKQHPVPRAEPNDSS